MGRGGKGDEQGVVPVQVGNPDIFAGANALVYSDHLGGAGLAGEQIVHVRVRLGRVFIGGAVVPEYIRIGTMHHHGHGVAHVAPVVRVFQQHIGHGVLFRKIPQLAIDTFQHARPDHAAFIGDHRRRGGKLQGRGPHVALADGGIDGIARIPGIAAGFHFPVPGGQDPGAGIADIQGQIVAKTEQRHEIVNLVDAHGVAKLVEKGVAGLVNRLAQVGLAVAAANGGAHGPVVPAVGHAGKPEPARVHDGVFVVDMAEMQPGEPQYGLDG